MIDVDGGRVVVVVVVVVESEVNMTKHSSDMVSVAVTHMDVNVVVN